MQNSKEKMKCFQRFKRKLIFRQTKAESLFSSLLTSMGLKFKEQRGFFAKTKTFFIADFYLSKPYRVVIEIDGGYHRTTKQLLKDLAKEEYFNLRRYHVIRFCNEDVENNIAFVKKRLKKFLKQAIKANTSARLRKDRPVLLDITYERA